MRPRNNFHKPRRGVSIKTSPRQKQTSKIVEPSINRERPSSKKFDTQLITSTTSSHFHSFSIRPENREPNKFFTLKGNPNVPSFKIMSDDARSTLLLAIRSYGNTPSRIVAKATGTTPGAVGAIRRHWIKNWRNLGNQYITK